VTAAARPDPAATVDALNALVARLRERVPFYAERLAGKQVRSLAEVAELPFTVKDDFRDSYPYGLLAVPLDQVVRLHMSSGTTGKPVVTAYTRPDLDGWAECIERTLRFGDVTERDVFQNSFGYGLFTGGLGLHLGAERIGCAVVPTSAGVTQRQLMLLQDLGVTALSATPSYTLVLAEALVNLPARPELKLRVVFCGAEPWSESIRREIESALGVEAFDIYGLTELGGPGVAAECHQHQGLHLFEDYYYPEVVDPDSGQPLPEGQPGELVLTSLRREAAPVLRYRTRDRTVLTSVPCPCGSPFRRFLRVQGRTDDMLVIRGENIFPSQVEEILLAVEGLTPNYQLVVDRGARTLDTLDILVETERHDQHEALARTAAERIKQTIGLTVNVTVLGAGALPRSEGKARRVIDRRELG
jgi:phenylacetate-CoA ligase